MTHLLSSVQSCPTLCDPMNPACQASLSITNSWSSLRLAFIDSVMPSSQLILCRPLLLRPPIPPSIRVFYNESTLRIRWPKYWSFSFSISPSNEHPGLISFRMAWLDLLAVQGLSRVFSSTAVQKHQLFGTQLSSQSNSHPHMTAGKTIALTRWTFVGKVMSLLFNKALTYCYAPQYTINEKKCRNLASAYPTSHSDVRFKINSTLHGKDSEI